MFARLQLARLLAAAVVMTVPVTWVQAAAAQTVEAHPIEGAGFPFGLWRNPKDTVHIEIRPCGQAACGYVVWASAKAEADVKRAGDQPLIGSQLFRDFTPIGGDAWRGKVFVPDLRMTFSGTAKPVEGTGLRARGCLVANYICKSQIWLRTTPRAD